MKADVRSVDSTCIPLRIDQQGTLSTLTFTARRDGEYDMTITHAGRLLPNMPIRIVATTASSEPLRVGIYGRGSYEARVNEEVEFFIDASRAPVQNSNQLNVRLSGKQTDIDVRIRQIEKNRNIFICSYKATIPGIFVTYLNISMCSVSHIFRYLSVKHPMGRSTNPWITIQSQCHTKCYN